MRIYLRMKNISFCLWQAQLFTMNQCRFSLHNKPTLSYFIAKRYASCSSPFFSESVLSLKTVNMNSQKSMKISKKNLNLSTKQKYKLFTREYSDVHEKSSASVSQSSVGQILELCEKQLKMEEISESQLDAEYIVSRVLNINRTDLHMHMNEVVSLEALRKINEMMRCRLARMPIQYIFGDWEFHSVTLKMRPPVFIPRPETEGLVNLTIRMLREDVIAKPLVLDVGCGSGAISLVLLNMVPELTCVALDQSKYAVDLTLENARNLNLLDRLHVVRGKITDEAFPILPFDKFDIIVSNPPYVLKKDIADLQPEIALYEDMRALYGGVEGLDVIQKIILHGQHLLKDNGRIIFETDHQHFYSLPTWLARNETTMNICQFYKDIYGMQRYIELKKKSKINK